MPEAKVRDFDKIADLKQSLNHIDPSIRFNAALDLAQLGETDGIPTLIEGFRADSFVTRLFHAGQALVALGETAVPSLREALDAEDGTTRVGAAYTLWKIDATRGSDLLQVAIEALRSWKPELSLEEQMRTPLVDAATFLGEMGTAAHEAIPVLLEMLHTRVRRDDPLAWNEDLRALLAFLLTQIADAPDVVVDALRQALNAGDDSLRWGAARALGELGEAASKSIPALQSLLADEKEVESIRVEAAYSLAVMADPLQVTLPTLKEAFHSKDWWVRVFVVRIMGEMGAPPVQTKEEKLFWLDRAFFSFRNVRRISRPDRHVVPFLIGALVDENYNVRRNAIYALSLVSEYATEAIPALFDAMRSSDVGPVAAEALAKQGEVALTALVHAFDQQSEPLQRHAAYALRLINTQAAADALANARTREVEPLQPAPHHFYVQCRVTWDPEKVAAFNALYEETLVHGLGSEVVYTLPYPKHEFLRYLVEHKGLFMHGTDLADLEELRPLRDSTDSNEHGNVSGVYADKGYMRPIYFAVVHRGRCFGLHNGFFDLREDGTVTRDEDQGLDRRYYKLAIGVTGLRRNPWRNGTVYALPPDTFEHWNEWTSRTPVRPVLRLAVVPDDLPLKDDVWGTDYRKFAQGTWVNPEEDDFPFLKDACTTPIHPAGRPPWLREE